MITAILGILGSSAFGSLLGGLFAILNRKSDLAAKALDLEHEAKKWAHELVLRDKDAEVARAEALGRKDVAMAEAEGRIESARFEAIAAAQAADTLNADELKAAGKWRGLLVWADAFRRFIRPAATICLLSTALWLSLLLIGMLQDDGWKALAPDQKIDLGKMALNWVYCQAGAALGYWFVSRGQSK